jgi:hypothetical protein
VREESLQTIVRRASILLTQVRGLLSILPVYGSDLYAFYFQRRASMRDADNTSPENPHVSHSPTFLRILVLRL